MSGLHSKFRRNAPDEGDGDLGLQGMHLETSPPRISKALDSPTERGHTLQVIKSRFGSQSKAKNSSTSIGSSSYFSAKDEDDHSKGFNSPSSPGFSTATSTTNKEPQTPSQSPVSSNSTPSKSKDESAKSSSSSKSKNRFSKLRADVAGPPSQRPLAGSSNGPSLSPRSASTAGFSSNSAFSKGKGRPSSNGEGRRRSSSGAGTGDLSSSSPREKSFTLTSGKSKSGLLVGSPVFNSLGSTQASSSSSKPNLTIPGRRTSLAPDKVRGKSRESGKPSLESLGRRPTSGGSGTKILASSSSGDVPTMKNEMDETDIGSKEAGLQRWVLSVGCVNFDLEKGPDLEFLYPSLGISREERDNIAFSSFPDTSIFDDGQAVFSWRVREVPLDSSGSEAPVIASSQQQSTFQTKPLTSKSPSSLSRASKGSPNSNSQTSSHKLWSFDRSWMQSSRTLSSDSANLSGVVHSHDSSRSITPLPTTGKQSGSNSPALPSSPSSESPTKSQAPMERLGSSGTHSSIISEEVRASSSAVNTSEASIPKSGAASGEAVDSTPGSSNGILRTARNSTSSNYIHGYCFFRQRRDASIRRGYFQKSVVILSHLPYVSLFSEIVKKLGPLYFQNGMPALEAFSQDVQNWPPPEPGARMHLPLLGSVISVDLPFHSQFQKSLSAEARIFQNTNTTGKARSGLDVRMDSVRGIDKGGSGEEPILASIPSTPLFDVFRESLDHLWLLWECLLLAEPILVVGPDPKMCSEAVWHLIDLIRPIPFAGDFRPFFTIHDYDFQTLVTKNKPNSGVILGVTNPFMLQACKHWPHVFKVGKAAIKTSARIAARKGQNSTPQHSFSGSQGGSGGGIAGGNSAGGGGPEHVPGLLSKRKRRISKDRPLLRKLIEMAEKGTDDEAANAMLRRYFSDLTGENK